MKIATSQAAAQEKNRVGELDCFNCSDKDHWEYECSKLNTKQQKELVAKRDAQKGSGKIICQVGVVGAP